ncbi:hypothetical protein JW998_14345, partial [candidate division KSB1 bacterium]|nr:hypothetical protein [candidate division KSB1 bacterium]
KNDFSYPTACAIRFRFAAGPQTPELELFWYDGGMKPRLGREIEAYNVEMQREGILYVGDDGAIFAEFNGGNPQWLAKGEKKPLWEETESREGRRRNTLWLDAMLSSEQSAGSFLNTKAITDTVNLGTVALRAGKKVIFDSETMQITNDADANKYLYRDCRPGWEL